MKKNYVFTKIESCVDFYPEYNMTAPDLATIETMPLLTMITYHEKLSFVRDLLMKAIEGAGDTMQIGTLVMGLMCEDMINFRKECESNAIPRDVVRAKANYNAKMWKALSCENDAPRNLLSIPAKMLAFAPACESCTKGFCRH